MRGLTKAELSRERIEEEEGNWKSLNGSHRPKEEKGSKTLSRELLKKFGISAILFLLKGFWNKS